MARWQRDPKARQRVVYVLAAAEVVGVTASFYLIFSAYLLRIWLLMTVGTPEMEATVYYAARAATAVCFVVGVFVGIMYARGRSWARRVFIVANAVLLTAGVVWFVKSQVLSSRTGASVAAWGLLLPILVLFPLLWPLIVFRPKQTATSETRDA